MTYVSHEKILAKCIADGLIKRVGDSYEITPKGHTWTTELARSLPTRSTFEEEPEILE